MLGHKHRDTQQVQPFCDCYMYPPSLRMVSLKFPTPLSSFIPHSKRTSGSSILMTSTLEPLVHQSPTNGKETTIVPTPVPPQPCTTQSVQPLNSTSAKATNLLQSFLEAYKEVESYRYVRRDWSCSWHVLKFLFAEMEIRS